MSEEFNRVTVLIVDDHPIYRDGLRRALQETPEFLVIGEAADGEQAVRLASDLHPSIILLDFTLPDFSALEILHRLRDLKLTSFALLLTASIDRQQITEALQLGARGIVMKDAGIEILYRSMRAILRGEYWIGHELMANWIDYMKSTSPHARVTPREREVITRILQGLSNHQIASTLGISDETVKRHISNVYEKLGISNRMELALYVSSGKLNGPA